MAPTSTTPKPESRPGRVFRGLVSPIRLFKSVSARRCEGGISLRPDAGLDRARKPKEELNRRFNSAPAAICDSSPWNQGGPHCQDEESGKVTKEVTNGTCRLCVARFSSRHLILTTLDRANGSLSAEEAVFPSSASLPRASPPIAPGAY